VPSILAVERYLPPFRYEQDVITNWVKTWLADVAPDDSDRLLSVYSSAGVKARASVVPIEDVFSLSDFETRNDRYRQIAIDAGTDVSRRVLTASGLSAQEIGMLVSVSCTGFMIPAVDAYVAGRLGLGPRLARLPITESGCAGGVVGLARAVDYLSAHPEQAALVLALEFSSLTFQRWDHSATNVISAAIFGDGGAAVALVGREHPRFREGRVLIEGAESSFFPGTSHFMGFRLRNQGLQIILDRDLTPFVRREVAEAVRGFLQRRGLTRGEVTRWILHPGGRKIIEAMSEQLALAHGELAATERVLSEHGNMSSVTVLFVLDEILRAETPRPGEKGVLGAFGPGFGAEFALLEFR
jgi:alkylresorcinol/alkylpyrone synthase